jgi:hypothetical protein
MKKIFLGTASAICAAIGFSSFKGVSIAGPFLFDLNVGIDIAKGVSGSTLLPSQVHYITNASEACGSGAGFDAVVTFATSNLTSGHQHLVGSIPVTIRRTICTRAMN